MSITQTRMLALLDAAKHYEDANASAIDLINNYMAGIAAGNATPEYVLSELRHYLMAHESKKHSVLIATEYQQYRRTRYKNDWERRKKAKSRQENGATPIHFFTPLSTRRPDAPIIERGMISDEEYLQIKAMGKAMAEREAQGLPPMPTVTDDLDAPSLSIAPNAPTARAHASPPPAPHHTSTFYDDATMVAVNAAIAEDDTANDDLIQDLSEL